jgi:mRNA interferase YafQ
MLALHLTKKYEKSLKKYLSIKKFSRFKLDEVILKLQNQIPLDKKFQDHPLKGELSHQRECHIYPDILLVYEVLEDQLILILVNLGSHSELF